LSGKVKENEFCKVVGTLYTTKCRVGMKLLLSCRRWSNQNVDADGAVFGWCMAGMAGAWFIPTVFT